SARHWSLKPQLNIHKGSEPLECSFVATASSIHESPDSTRGAQYLPFLKPAPKALGGVTLSTKVSDDPVRKAHRQRPPSPNARGMRSARSECDWCVPGVPAAALQLSKPV